MEQAPVQSNSAGAYQIPQSATALSLFAWFSLPFNSTIYDISRKSALTAGEVNSAWRSIPNGILGQGKAVNLGDSNIRVGSAGNLRNGKTGWEKSPDKSQQHKGGKWKLVDKKGTRVASLDPNGRIVGKE